MRPVIASGLATDDAGVDAFAEASARAALALGGRPVDLAVVFAGEPNLAYVDEGLAAVEERLGPRALIGCGAQGVIAGRRELERGGVAVLAARLPGAHAESFHLHAVRAESQIAVTGMPDLDGADAVLMVTDPYTFPVEPLLDRVSGQHSGLPVIGGIASGLSGRGEAALFHDGRVERAGAVGVTLRGVDVRPCVSQGARPVGPEMVITAAEGHVIEELAFKPALTRLREAIGGLPIDEQMLAARGVLLGIVIDENQPEYERGDFLVRGVLRVDDEAETVAVGERVRVGQTVRLQVRDGPSADADLRAALARELGQLERAPAGALVFTCNGRGSNMFDTPDHDAGALADACGDIPAAGFFCAGEIGPVGDRNFVHGFTATVALFGG